MIIVTYVPRSWRKLRVDMNDIFEHIERKVYKRTFLQQVDVRLEYPILKEEKLTSELVGAVDLFFKNH